MFGTSFQLAQGYMEIAPDADRGTLTDVPSRNLSVNSVIHWDEWRGMAMGYITTISHSLCQIAFNTIQ